MEHWDILQRVERDFTDKVREFMVIGDGGEGVVMVTEPDGEGFWFGEMKFGDESKEATELTLLGVRNLVGMAHGRDHIVLLDRMGMVYTLGENYYGQLGQGTVRGTHFTPQLIQASPGRFTKVRCGNGHSLALTQDGKVWAWGWNDSGQVGLPRSTPEVPSLNQIDQLDSHRVVAIECGAYHSLALTDQGQVYGWGDNGWGQLAQNTRSSLSTPVLLPCARQVTQIAAGHRHTLLLADDGQVFACGLNDCGQLGRPNSTYSSSSLCQVSGLPPISQIASHFRTRLSIALSTDRRCFVWGEWNQATTHTPLQLPPTYSTIESPLSSMSTHRNTPQSVRVKVPQFPLTSDFGSQTEQFEQSTLGQSSQHWDILQRVKRGFRDKVREFMVIGDGGEGVVMVTEPYGEGIWFGKMKFGNKSKEATKPTRLGVRNLVGMAHGKNHIVLLDGMGMVYTLGMNDCGQLGLGIVGATHFTPQLIPECPVPFTMVRCGCWYSLALTQDGKVWAWGRNDSGQVGLPNFTSIVPSMRQIAQLDSHRVVAIECGGFHSLALTDQGQVYGWGYNGWGQLARNTPTSLPCQSSLFSPSSESAPVRLPCARPVTQIAAGLFHTLLLADDGQVFACGSNDCGQLGLPTSTESSSSLCQVSGLPPISQIASHFDTDLSIALSTDRRCFVWGEWNRATTHTPLQLPPTYSTIESPLSSNSTTTLSQSRNTPHSVRVKGQHKLGRTGVKTARRTCNLF